MIEIHAFKEMHRKGEMGKFGDSTASPQNDIFDWLFPSRSICYNTKSVGPALPYVCRMGF